MSDPEFADSGRSVQQSPHADEISIDRRDFLRQSGLAVAALAAMPVTARASLASSEIVNWDADELSRQIKSKSVSCAEVMDAYLRSHPSLQRAGERHRGHAG